MTLIASTNLDQIRIDESHPWITMITPRAPGLDLSALSAVFDAHRPRLMQLLTRRGVLLFRGFDPHGPEAFHDFVLQATALPSWNSFNVKGLPGFLGNWLRRYTEGLMGGGDYRRYLGSHTVQLGPVEAAVQGPHVEGGGSPRRSRHLALCCFHPAAERAETGLVDLHAVFRSLPRERQAKYLSAFNRFYYLTQRPLNWLDRLLLTQTPVEVSEALSDGRAKLASPLTPAVCAHPETGLPCLQPWAFTRNTNGHVHEAALAAFPNRGIAQRCSNADGMDFRWDLCDARGRGIDWSDDEQRELFDTIFAQAELLDWRQGDIALIDNIRIGHWRMNGEQGRRQLVQVQIDAFDAQRHRVLAPPAWDGDAPARHVA